MSDNNYILVRGCTIYELVPRVNNLLDSYEPLGGPIVYGKGLVQAMIKIIPVDTRRQIEMPQWVPASAAEIKEDE